MTFGRILLHEMNSFTPFSEKFTLKLLMTEASPNWGGQQYRLLREALGCVSAGMR